MPSAKQPLRPDPALLKELRGRIRTLEEAPAIARPQGIISFGVEAIDAALPWGGLPRGGLHELIPADSSAAAAGFCAWLLARLAGTQGTVAWCRRARDLYGPGLSAFGLSSERLIVVQTRNDTEVLWAAEEGLRSGALAAVVAETGIAQPVPLRRLQLAAETHSTAALLLRPFGAQAAASPAVTRWSVGAAPSASMLADESRPSASNHQISKFVDRPIPRLGTKRWIRSTSASSPAAVDGPSDVRFRWRVALVRCRRGAAGPAAPPEASGTTPESLAAWDPTSATWASTAWLVEWNDETGGLTVDAELRDRPTFASPELRAENLGPETRRAAS